MCQIKITVVFLNLKGNCVTNKDVSLAENLFAVRWRGTRSIAAFMPENLDVQQTLPEGQIKLPYAIGILRCNKEEISEMTKISLGSGSQEKVLDPSLELLIREHLEDLIIFRHASSVTQCGFFERICPQMEGKQNYIIRNYARQRENEVEDADEGTVTVTLTRPVGGTPNQNQPSRNVGGRPSGLQKATKKCKLAAFLLLPPQVDPALPFRKSRLQPHEPSVPQVISA